MAGTHPLSKLLFRGNTGIFNTFMTYLLKHHKRTLPALTLVFCAGLSMLPTYSAAAVSYSYVSFAAASKSAAAEQARAQYGGKVLKVDETTDGGRTVYRVKLLLDGGRIKIVTVSASNG